MYGVIDVWQQIHVTNLHLIIVSINYTKKKSSFLDAPENPLGSCLDVTFSYKDHLLYSHVEVESGVEFMPSSFNTLKNT